MLRDLLATGETAKRLAAAARLLIEEVFSFV